MKKNPDISIIILTYNGLSDHFRETLGAILAQEINYSYEIIVIDSGSSDGTVDFIRQNPNVKLVQIKNSEFSHGGTRQLGVELSSGRYIVYLTQDAKPMDKFWLKNLISKLISKEEIVAVSSRILPRPQSMVLRKYNVMSEWCAAENDFEISFENISDFKQLSPQVMREYTKVHDVSSAYKRSFMEKYGFDSIPFGEDVIIASKVLENGFSIAFASKSVVIHSHEYRIIETFKRNLADARFNKKFLNRRTTDSLIKVAWFTYKVTKKDFLLLLSDNISFLNKIICILYSPLIHCAEQIGQYIGMMGKWNDNKAPNEFLLKCKFMLFSPWKFGRKYFSKTRYLFFSYTRSIRNEGINKSFRRAINYLLHGKGILKYKNEVRIKDQYDNFSEAIKKFHEEAMMDSSNEDGIILYFDHELGGGANCYKEKYIENTLLHEKKIMVVTYSSIEGVFHLRYYESKEVLMYALEDFSRLLTMPIKIKKIVLSGIVSYERPLWILREIEKIKEIFGSNLEVLVHDYFCVCPNFTLVDHMGKYCNLPDNDYCKTCMSKNQGDFRLFVKNRDVIEWKKAWSNFLSKADSIVCFSESSREILKRTYLGIGDNKIYVIPHEVSYIRPIKKKQYGNGHTFTIGILGGISVIKGFNVIREMAEIIDNNKLSVKIVVIGEVVGNIESNNVTVLGKYSRSEISKLTINNEIDVFFVPSICPETFSYTTEEVIKMGFPIAVFDLGAPAERIRNYDKGVIIPEVNSAMALDIILKMNKSTSK